VNIQLLIFAFVAAMALTTAVLMITQRNPVMSAIALIGNFFCLAGLYLLLHAQFLAALQIMIYTGAIMVLVIFVIMLLNLGDEQSLKDRKTFKAGAGIALATGLLLELVVILVTRPSEIASTSCSVTPVDVGTIESIGKALFSRFMLPFEAISILLLVAVAGAVVLAKKKL
jgi:NADH-quinone oxidoreductase subunit J